jgi:DNA repair protein RecN (Recombination protein N)
MLETLRIENLGAVDELSVDLEPGLTALTGETGVGKTLLVEALHLVLGGADRSVPVRDPGRTSRVQAVFASEGAEVVLARERSEKGRLRASLDGALTSAAALAERAGELCELHGQHEHQVLRTPGAARRLLDRAGHVDDGEVRQLRAALREQRDALERLGGDAQDRARRLALVAHECEEIDAADLAGPDEIDRLLEEGERLATVLAARDALRSAAEALDGDGDAPTAAGLLAGAVAALPRGLGPRRDELDGLLAQVREAAGALRRDLDEVAGDPERLDHLHERIALLQALVRKHGHDLADVLARRVTLGADLERLRDDEARSATLDAELAGTSKALVEAEGLLLERRRRAASALAADVTSRLAPLALPHARFEVDVDGPGGDQVGFRFAGSGAFEPAPLAEAASGGELSRVMLALTLATGAAAPCLVFDEVDAGVGGATARALAACLAELAETRQVLVVTHLATVAAAAANHLVVTRAATADGPASVAVVTGGDRAREVARLLAGDASDPVALAHAEALLAGDTADA